MIKHQIIFQKMNTVIIITILLDDSEDPAAQPILWISKWVDYTDKYGLGYQLCDNSNGVLFNDSTRILLYANGDQIEYIDKDINEYYYTLRTFPESLIKKVTLLKYFRNYMSEHLLKVGLRFFLCYSSSLIIIYLKAGASMAPKEGDQFSRLPFLRTWFRTRSAIILHLSNGTLQINFFAVSKVRENRIMTLTSKVLCLLSNVVFINYRYL